MMNSLQQYAWQYFGAHCIEGGQVDALQNRLFNYDWLERKLKATDVANLIADCDRVSKSSPNADMRKDVLRLSETLRLSAHVLETSPDQLPHQLFGRLSFSHLESERIKLDALKRSAHDAATSTGISTEHSTLISGNSALERTIVNPGGPVKGAILLDEKRALTWDLAGVLRIFFLDEVSDPQVVGKNPNPAITGVLLLNEDRILVWGSFTLYIFSLNDDAGQPRQVPNQSNRQITKVFPIGSPRQVLLWDVLGRVWVCDLDTDDSIQFLSFIPNLGQDDVLAGVEFFGSGGVAWTSQGTMSRFEVVRLEDENPLTAKVWVSPGEQVNVAMIWCAAGDIAGPRWDDRPCVIALDEKRVLSSSKTLGVRAWNFSGVGGMFPVSKDQIDSASDSMSRGLRVGIHLPAGQLLESMHELEIPSQYSVGVEGGVRIAADRLVTYGRTMAEWNIGAEKVELLPEKFNNDKDCSVVSGAIRLEDSRLLTWSRENVFVWDINKSPAEKILLGSHDWTVARPECDMIYFDSQRGVHGGTELPGHRALTWGYDGTLRIWNLEKGMSDSKSPQMSSSAPGRLCLLPGGEALLWAMESIDNKPMRRLSRGNKINILDCPSNFPPEDAIAIDDQKVLFWNLRVPDRGGAIEVWQLSDAPQKLYSLPMGVTEVIKLKDGRLIHWDMGGAIYISSHGKHHDFRLLGRHINGLVPQTLMLGIAEVAENRLVSWGGDGTFNLWDIGMGPHGIIKRTTQWFRTRIDGGDNPLCQKPIWSYDAVEQLRQYKLTCKKTDHWVASESNDGWPHDCPAMIDHEYAKSHLCDYAPEAVYELEPEGRFTPKYVGDIIPIGDSRLLFWGGWWLTGVWLLTAGVDEPPKLVGFQRHMDRVMHLQNSRILTWSTDNDMVVWSIPRSIDSVPAAIATRQHPGRGDRAIRDAILLEGNVLMTLSSIDRVLRFWDCESLVAIGEYELDYVPKEAFRRSENQVLVVDTARHIHILDISPEYLRNRAAKSASQTTVQPV